MMQILAQWWGLIVTLAIIAGLAVALKLRANISGGASHAGAMNRVEPTVPGLTASAWDAQTIETALTQMPEAVIALLESVASSLKDGKETTSAQSLGVSGQAAITHMVDQLEQRLELPPLTPSLPGNQTTQTSDAPPPPVFTEG